MPNLPPPLGSPRATATAHRKDAAALRSVARAQHRRARTLRAVAQAYVAEADREHRAWAAQLLRDFATHSETLAAVIEGEAVVHEREAERVEAAAQRADARALTGRGSAGRQ